MNSLKPNRQPSNKTKQKPCTKFSLVILAFAFTQQNDKPVVVLHIRSCVAPLLFAQLDVDIALYESP